MNLCVVVLTELSLPEPELVRRCDAVGPSSIRSDRWQLRRHNIAGKQAAGSLHSTITEQNEPRILLSGSSGNWADRMVHSR